MSKLLISFAILATFSTIHGALHNDKTYFLQNVADNTHLRVSRPGKLCERAGEVITTSALNKSDPLSQFKYRELGTIHVLGMDSEKVSSMNRANEVTMDSNYTCYFQFRNYNYHKLSGNTYYLSTNDGQKKNQCLNGNGNDKRISFVPCDPNDPNQHWKFIEV